MSQSKVIVLKSYANEVFCLIYANVVFFHKIPTAPMLAAGGNQILIVERLLTLDVWIT